MERPQKLVMLVVREGLEVVVHCFAGVSVDFVFVAENVAFALQVAVFFEVHIHVGWAAEDLRD